MEKEKPVDDRPEPTRKFQGRRGKKGRPFYYPDAVFIGFPEATRTVHGIERSVLPTGIEVKPEASNPRAADTSGKHGCKLALLFIYF